MNSPARWMTDGGLETALIFRDGFDLPHFAAFPLLYDEAGRVALRGYFESFLTLSDEIQMGFVLETPTWRANRDWGEMLGYSRSDLVKANADSVAFARTLAAGRSSVLIEGVVGPRGDGYLVTHRMGADEAADYHSDQIAALQESGADRVAALTLTYPEEAIGVVRAAQACGIPIVPSFTVETDGRLPDGTLLGDAIAQVDRATGSAALFFMVNCAHPHHVARGLGNPVTADRIGGLRVNASELSHAELDDADELDDGDPVTLGRDNAALRDMVPQVQVLGGCCGTDSRHVREIVTSWYLGTRETQRDEQPDDQAAASVMTKRAPS